MKKELIHFLLCSFTLLFCLSCSKSTEENLGYPKVIRFTSEGGVQVFTNDKGEYGRVEIIGKIDYIDASDGVYRTGHDWLDIETDNPEVKGVKLIAAPNNTGKSRKISIKMIHADEYQVVTVKQD